MRVLSLKMNYNVYPLRNTNSHYLLLNTTIMPVCNGKISLFFGEGLLKKSIKICPSLTCCQSKKCKIFVI